MPQVSSQATARRQPLRYTSGMALVGRRKELAELERLLTRAASSQGGAAVITGPPGSGRTELGAAATRMAIKRGFEVIRVAALTGGPDTQIWAQILRDVGADELAARLVQPTDAASLDSDAMARAVASTHPRLLFIDDIDHGEPSAAQVLAMVATRAAGHPLAVIATSVLSIGVGVELALEGLSEDELSAMLPDLTGPECRAVWQASRGLPGIARALAANLTRDWDDGDPLAQLALTVPSRAEFLDVDPGLVRLLEDAIPRVRAGSVKARLLARLARELLGDATASSRRRLLADEALELARQADEPAVLAEVLDARLHALWDPAGAEDRLAASSEIIDLARASGDARRERHGMFWRFVALMELGRVTEAESALAAFERAAAEAGDGTALVMATARHAMLATLRGRFNEATRLTDEVASQAQRVRLPDADRLVAALRGELAFYLGPAAAPFTVDQLLALARRIPGHFMEANAAAWLALEGRLDEAAAELDRIRPAVLAGSGPRWLGAAAMLAFVATRTRDTSAAAQLREALAPYQGRLAVIGGANSCVGPVSYFLGLLDLQVGFPDRAVACLTEAVTFAEQAGALPSLAMALDALADALMRRQAVGDRQQARACGQRAHTIAERLGVPRLLDQLKSPTDQWMLRQDGQDWQLTAGDEHARLRDSRGLHYLRALLAAPGIEIPALDLAAGGTGLAIDTAEPVLDDAARAAYRRRIGDLDRDLEAADRGGNSAAAERAQAERDALIDELRRATGLAGRTRGVPANAERARVNVTRTIRAAIDRISQEAPIAGAHLQSSIRTGIACRYQPAPGGPAGWRTQS